MEREERDHFVMAFWCQVKYCDDLINKAITDNATRSTEEIHEYIAAFATIDPII